MEAAKLSETSVGILPYHFRVPQPRRPGHESWKPDRKLQVSLTGGVFLNNVCLTARCEYFLWLKAYGETHTQGKLSDGSNKTTWNLKRGCCYPTVFRGRVPTQSRKEINNKKIKEYNFKWVKVNDPCQGSFLETEGRKGKKFGIKFPGEKKDTLKIEIHTRFLFTLPKGFNW
jgi:hypothetical protein